MLVIFSSMLYKGKVKYKYQKVLPISVDFAIDL